MSRSKDPRADRPGGVEGLLRRLGEAPDDADPRERRRRSIVEWTSLAAGAAGAVLFVLWGLVGDLVVHDPHPGRRHPILVIAVLVGCIVGGIAWVVISAVLEIRDARRPREPDAAAPRRRRKAD